MKAAVYLEATGAVIGAVSGDLLPTPEAGTKHLTIAAGIDPTGMTVIGGKLTAPPTGYDPATWTWDAQAHAFVEDVGRVEVLLVGRVKDEGERRRMLVLSPGGSKKTVYSLKQNEVDQWNDLASTLTTAIAAFLGLPVVKQRRKFRFAMAEAALRGEPSPAAAIARFAAGSDAANAEAARVEAIEQAGVAAIKAATTATAKRAAYAAINWAWAPA